MGLYNQQICAVSSNLVDFVIGSFRACALETIRMVMIVCLSTPAAFGEGRAPKITVTKSTRFHELENIYFVGNIALPIRPLSQR